MKRIYFATIFLSLFSSYLKSMEEEQVNLMSEPIFMKVGFYDGDWNTYLNKLKKEYEQQEIIQLNHIIQDAVTQECISSKLYDKSVSFDEVELAKKTRDFWKALVWLGLNEQDESGTSKSLLEQEVTKVCREQLHCMNNLQEQDELLSAFISIKGKSTNKYNPLALQTSKSKLEDSYQQISNKIEFNLVNKEKYMYQSIVTGFLVASSIGAYLYLYRKK